MVMAKLHVICGNCGCSDDFEWSYRKELVIDGDIIDTEEVSLYCANCSTIHALSDNAKTEDKGDL